MAARKNKITLSDTWRERISAGVIMDRLIKHFNGDLELTTTQLKAAQLVLSKIVPDLARTEMTGQDGKDLIPSNIQIQLVKPNAITAT